MSTQTATRGSAQVQGARAPGGSREFGAGASLCPPYPRRQFLRDRTAQFVNRFWLKEAVGLENAPTDRPYIVAAPHASYMDLFVVGAVFYVRLDHKLRYWAKSRMFQHRILGAYCRAAGCLEVAEGAAHRDLWRASLEALHEGGENICVFPEGTRTRSGEPGPFHIGYLKLARDAGVPVVPLRIEGAYEVWPPGRPLPRRGALRVEMHEPVEVPAGSSLAALARLNRGVREACVPRR